jgi:hypothetical protein
LYARPLHRCPAALKAAANRRNADAMELERLAASLTTTVVAVDAVSPMPPFTAQNAAARISVPRLETGRGASLRLSGELTDI